MELDRNSPRQSAPRRHLARLLGLAALGTWLASTPAPAETYNWTVTRVIDGDTIEVRIPEHPEPFELLSVRLNGVDTPEKGGRAKCDAERLLGDEATAFVAARIKPGDTIQVANPFRGKFAGRVVADIILDGHQLAKLLIDAGLARAYDGGTRGSWCEASTN